MKRCLELLYEGQQGEPVRKLVLYVTLRKVGLGLICKQGHNVNTLFQLQTHDLITFEHNCDYDCCIAWTTKCANSLRQLRTFQSAFLSTPPCLVFPISCPALEPKTRFSKKLLFLSRVCTFKHPLEFYSKCWEKFVSTSLEIFLAWTSLLSKFVLEIVCKVTV